jgi:two-component system response regulator TctD
MRYAAIVLDLGLPDEDGLALLRDMRRRGDSTPVLVLTARDGVTDKIAGLRDGADDYMAKPFAMEELVARLQALLRRPGNLLGKQLTYGNVALDTEGRQVIVDGTVRAFPARETAVLEILLRRGGNVAPKRLFEDHLSAVGRRRLNAVSLRPPPAQDEADAGATVKIHTVRGVGYLMAEEKGGERRRPSLGSWRCTIAIGITSILMALAPIICSTRPSTRTGRTAARPRPSAASAAATRRRRGADIPPEMQLALFPASLYAYAVLDRRVLFSSRDDAAPDSLTRRRRDYDAPAQQRVVVVGVGVVRSASTVPDPGRQTAHDVTSDDIAVVLPALRITFRPAGAFLIDTHLRRARAVRVASRTAAAITVRTDVRCPSRRCRPRSCRWSTPSTGRSTASGVSRAARSPPTWRTSCARLPSCARVDALEQGRARAARRLVNMTRTVSCA